MACNIYITITRPGISRAHIARVVSTVTKFLAEPMADISVHVVGKKKIRSLNRIFRGVDRPTDVLSFPTEESHAQTTRRHAIDAGDIFVCPDYIRAQAKRFNVSFREEMERMLIHGILHLRGYAHGTKREATRMFSLQESLLEDVNAL